MERTWHYFLVFVAILVLSQHVVTVTGQEPQLSDERVVFQLTAGDVEFGFFPDVGICHAAHSKVNIGRFLVRCLK
jgi:hypothetical protein